MTTSTPPSESARFREAYAAHRAAEGRRLDPERLRTLPYLTDGPVARQWGVRARTYDAFVKRLLLPDMATCDRPLRLLDLGAGNGWLSHRAGLAGCEATALDIRDDDVDGLGAATVLSGDDNARFERIVASFDALPLDAATFDVVVFNASLHYATDLPLVLREAHRVTRPGGRVVVLDSPFYEREEQGLAMVAEKQHTASARFGDRASVLVSQPFIEFLTRERLRVASSGLGLTWHRHRVHYPMWYEYRGLTARLRGHRAPSRFDLWETHVA
jgi:SAM-dependent methyltransferase